jgi:hypothetical protein
MGAANHARPPPSCQRPRHPLHLRPTGDPPPTEWLAAHPGAIRIPARFVRRPAAPPTEASTLQWNFNQALQTWLEQQQTETANQPTPSEATADFRSQHRLNLYQISDRYFYTVFNTTTLCSDRKLDMSLIISSFPYVFGPQGRVKQASNPLTRYDYISQSFHFYLIPSNDRACSWQPCEIKYDLFAHPHDICFRISGRALLTKSLESNVVVVPKSALIAAFDAAHIPHGQ